MLPETRLTCSEKGSGVGMGILASFSRFHILVHPIGEIMAPCITRYHCSDKTMK